MLDLALHYARSGWRIFPLAPLSKVPLPGSHGCKDATTDLRRIEAWWSQNPEANIGLATGRQSGVLVVDVDVRGNKPGLASIQKLELPQTFTVRTPSSGFHLYFAAPAARISIGADLLPGIDWRGDGGYAVAAGSRTAEGMYEIARNLPIADAPQSLVDRILATRSKPTMSAKDGRQVIAEGGRDHTLTRIAGALRRFGLGEAAILGALQAANIEHCVPPLPDSQLQKIARSVARYEPEARAR